MCRNSKDSYYTVDERNNEKVVKWLLENPDSIEYIKYPEKDEDGNWIYEFKLKKI